MKKISSDNKQNRRKFVKDKVSDLFNNPPSNIQIDTYNQAFQYIADNLLFCHYDTIRRIYKGEL